MCFFTLKLVHNRSNFHEFVEHVKLTIFQNETKISYLLNLYYSDIFTEIKRKTVLIIEAHIPSQKRKHMLSYLKKTSDHKIIITMLREYVTITYISPSFTYTGTNVFLITFSCHEIKQYRHLAYNTGQRWSMDGLFLSLSNSILSCQYTMLTGHLMNTVWDSPR